MARMVALYSAWFDVIMEVVATSFEISLVLWKRAAPDPPWYGGRRGEGGGRGWGEGVLPFGILGGWRDCCGDVIAVDGRGEWRVHLKEDFEK